MANELQKVGLVFTEEGAVDFKKTLQDISLELNKNYNQFKLTQAQWDSSTSSTEKLRAQQEYLTNAYQIQHDKVNTLRMQLEELENSENKNTTAINKKRNELTKAEIKLQDYNSRLKEVDAQLNDSNQKLQQYGKKISDVSEKISDVGNKASIISAGAAAGGIALTNNAMNLENAVAKYVSTTNTAERETEKYQKILENIHNNNYGEGYEDIADSMAQVTMQLKDLNEQELQNITEKAIALRDLFGYDVSESVRAVKAMMDNLNVSADQAFNLIAEGKKQGLDFSNELLDNINEYSVQFGKLGLSAEDMFNIFKVGADNGAFNLDKIGDAVKEFSIRVIDGSNTTIDGFQRIGLNADEMAKKFANGGEEAKQAFIEVVNRLGSMDDKVSQSIAGVDLFGTMWEDLGPTVITSFSNMDAGISKSSDSMQESIDQLYNTTKKKAEAQLKRLQSLGADFGEEMLPVLEDLIDMAEGFVDKLNDMSDAEKENIVKIGLFVAALGPAIKTAGTAGQVIGGVTQGIGTFTQAIGVATGKTNSSVTSVNNLANVFKAVVSPAGIATVAITALTSAVVAYGVKTYNEITSLDGVSKSLKNQKEQWEQLEEIKNSSLDASLTEISIIQNLVDELDKIVDENGKVKESYENRANYILKELNSALGTEYSINQNVIEQYQTMQDEIQNLISQKKAEALLNAYQEEYAEALKSQSEATENLINLRNQLAEAQEKLVSSTGKERIETQQSINTITNAIREQTEMVDKYGYTIQNYENLQTASVSNSAEEVENAVAKMGQSWEKAKAQCEQSITQQVNSQATYVQNLKEALQDAKNSNDEYQTYVLNNQLETAQKQLDTLVSSMIEQTSTIQKLSQNEIDAWTNLANSNFYVYKNALSKLPIETQSEIEKATGVVALNSSLANATGNLASSASMHFDTNLSIKKATSDELQEAANEVSSDTGIKNNYQQIAMDATRTFIENSDGEKAGRQFVRGVESGLTNKTEVQGAVNASSSLGSKILDKFKDILGIHSPSKEAEEAAEYFLQGFIVGINGNQKEALKSIGNLAGNINDELSNGLGSSDYKIKAKGNNNSNYNHISQEVIQSIKDSNQKIIELLTKILAKNTQIVMDSGTLIGEIVEPIDQELGNRQSRRERGS